MKNLPLPSVKTDPAISVLDLKRYAEGWMLSCEIGQHSASTLANRRLYLRKFFWFLEHRSITCCSVLEMRQFFAYLTNGHKEPEGRWGRAAESQPVKPSTVATYHRHLGTFFRWIVSEGGLDASPMDRIPQPIDRPDDVEPFSEPQAKALLDASKKTRQPRRDEALLLFLLDSGCRVTEVCQLSVRDVEMSAKKVTVEGKGGKTRPVYFGRTTARALWQYLKEDERAPDDPLFQSERGERLTRSGVQQLIERIGRVAGIETVRCSPHTFRHTFAISFLRAGGNQFSLMQMLGHTDLKMTARYLKLAQADVENQHRQFSPVERMKGAKR